MPDTCYFRKVLVIGMRIWLSSRCETPGTCNFNKVRVVGIKKGETRNFNKVRVIGMEIRLTSKGETCNFERVRVIGMENTRYMELAKVTSHM